MLCTVEVWRLAGAVLMALAGQPTLAETVTLNFDPPTFAEGQVLGWVGDIGFIGNATVFRPSSVVTQSPPFALRTPAWCESPDCANAAYQINILFRRPVTDVSLRIGSETIPGNKFFCFPEGTYCTVHARLIGYNVNRVIADTRDVPILDAFSPQAPITQELSIADDSGRITSATVTIGRNTFEHDRDYNPGRIQIDQLTVNFADSTPTEPPLPDKPTLSINQPSGMLSPPYRFTVAGRWNAPGGLYALCLRVNESLPVQDLFCRNNVVINEDGTYWAEIYRSYLPPTGNFAVAQAIDLSGQKVSATIPLNVKSPNPPLVALYSPRPGLWLTDSSSELSASGTTFVPGGAAGFCLRIGTPAQPVVAPSQSECQDQRLLTAQGTFSGISLDKSLLQPGVVEVHAYIFDAWGQRGETMVKGTVPANLRISGVEFTQGSQTWAAFRGSGPYEGVDLVKEVPTIVRVFANAAAGGPFDSVNATLEGFAPNPRGGEEWLGLLLPDNGARTLKAGGWLTLDERAQPDGAYVFTLPQNWTTHLGALRLRATVNSRRVSGNWITECTDCGGDNTVDVTDINFKDPLPAFVVSPVLIRWTEPSGAFHDPPAVEKVFDDFSALIPLPKSRLMLRPYVTVVDASEKLPGGFLIRPNGIKFDGSCDEACRMVLFGIVGGFEVSNQPGLTIGITTAGVRGYTAPVTYVRWWPTFLAWELVAIASTTFGNAPLKLGVAHELLHQAGFLHASPACGADTQLAEDWPPDHMGRLQGVGLDRRPGSGTIKGTYAVFVDRDANPQFDVMSYCAGGPNSWLSPKYWNAFGHSITFSTLCLPFPGACQSSSAPSDARQSTRIMAVESPVGRWSIVDVRQTLMPLVAPTGDPSPLRFVARDRAGRVLADEVAHVSSGSDAHGARVATADLPAVGAASVTLQSADQVLAQRVASMKPPRISIAEPVVLEPTASPDEVRVRWLAADDDGEPLAVTVEYSVDQGPFVPIGVTGRLDGMNLPRRLFSASSAARLRLSVNDGMNEASIVTASFKSEGAPPVVSIVDPVGDVAMLSTGTLNLTGAAFDDRGWPLDGMQATWELDGKPLGTGLTKTLVRPDPGRHELLLRARDRLQREAVARRTIDVTDGGIQVGDQRDEPWWWFLLMALVALL